MDFPHLVARVRYGMTLIVSPKVFTSKAALKAALDEGRVLVTDPSTMGGWVTMARELPVGFRGVCTDHPRRSRYAEIERKETGWKVS